MLNIDYIKIVDGNIVSHSAGMTSIVPISDIRRIHFDYSAKGAFIATWTVETDSDSIIWGNETDDNKGVVSYLDKHLDGFSLQTINERVRNGGIEGSYEVWPRIARQIIEDGGKEPESLNTDKLTSAELRRIYDGLARIRAIRDWGKNHKVLLALLATISLVLLTYDLPLYALITMGAVIWYSLIRLRFTRCPRCHGLYHRLITLSHVYEQSTIWSDSNKCARCGLRMDELPEIKSDNAYVQPKSVFG